MSLWLGHRTAWLRLQFGVGVWNAWSMVNAIDAGSWTSSTISAACVLVTALWRLPPADDA